MIRVIIYNVIDNALSPNDLGVTYEVIDDYLLSLTYQGLLGIPKVEVSRMMLLAH